MGRFRVRTEEDMARALDGTARLRERAGRVVVHGNRQYDPAWHTAIDLIHLLTVSEAITRSALTRKESRGAHFREDFPAKDESVATVNTVVKKEPDASMSVRHDRIPEMPAELRAIIEEAQ